MNKQRRLIFVGGGGHCRSVADVALSADCRILGFIDPDTAAETLGFPRLGDDPDMAEIASANPDAEFLVTTGQIKSSALRRRLVEALDKAGCKIAAPLAAPDAYVALFVKAGDGTVIMHKAVVNVGAAIGKHTIINTGAIIEHDCRIGDFCHISTGAVVNGGCEIGNDVFVGSRAVLAHGVKVADGVVIGAGSVVIHDITQAGIYCGSPAKLVANHED